MQAFKTLLIVAVLSAVSYGVYVALTGARDVEPPPGATPEDWHDGPQIELPQFDPAQSGAPPTITGSSASVAEPAMPQVVQPQPAAATEAPQYNAAPSHQDAAAPPFVAPSVGPSDASHNVPPVADPAAQLSPPAQEAPIAPGAAYHDQPAAAAPNVEMTAPPPAGDVVAPTNGAVPESNYATDLAAAHGLLAEHRLDPALLMLTRWYDDPRLTEQEQRDLVQLLNQLAGTVIYSREHLLLPPYEVQPGDTLDRVAQHYRVPWQLLAKINGVADPNQLPSGEKLKVVQGPFDATINMHKRQLTLMLGGRYAGSFPIGIGTDHSAPDGEFVVKTKTPNPPYYGPDRVIDANDPSNPLGKYWIGLDEHFGIHGTNDPASLGQADTRGCIRLAPRDIEDVYDMLTNESRVRILR